MIGAILMPVRQYFLRSLRMAETELEEIRRFWQKRYPNIDVTLYTNEAGDKYFGRMRGAESTMELIADTIGELIGQGEVFLRSLK